MVPVKKAPSQRVSARKCQAGWLEACHATGPVPSDPVPIHLLTALSPVAHHQPTHKFTTQVIMLDSDNSPLTDPTPLLDSAPFKTHGSIFWPDFWRDQWMKPALYR